MPFKLRLIPAAAAACLLASCGGGGGSSSEPAPTPTPSAGVAVDGYLIGSTVLCDSNANGLSDAGELSVGTDAGGNFRFNSGCTAALVVRGGSSVDTGLPFKGVLKAPAGATVVSPLTTMVAAGMTNAQVVAALGLTAGTDLLKTDPAASPNGALSNPGLMKATLAMQQLLQKLAGQLNPAAPPKLQWIQASVGQSIQMIPVEEVLFFISDEKYTRVQTATTEALIRKPIKELLEELDMALFWQIHRSTLVNTRAIAGVTRDLRGRQLVSVKGHPEKLEVSRSFTGLFKGM